jgi:hypothetical protein
MTFSIQPVPDVPEALMVTNNKTAETHVYTVDEAKDLVLRISEKLGLHVYTRMNQLEYRRQMGFTDEARESSPIT